MSAGTTPAEHCHGTTLIEVLVAVAILGVGVLGAVGTITQAIRTTHDARIRTTATAEAFGLLDAMRANRSAALAGAYDLSAGATPASPPTDCGLATATCSPAELAAWELARWHSRLQSVLPGLSAAVSTTATAGIGRATVQLAWDGDRDGTPESSVALTSDL